MSFSAQDEHGGAGVYQQDVRKRYLLEDDSWRHDIIPEIMDGHNVMDFVDPDIEAKLDALDREEDAQMAALAAQVGLRGGLQHASKERMCWLRVMQWCRLYGSWAAILCMGTVYCRRCCMSDVCKHMI